MTRTLKILSVTITLALAPTGAAVAAERLVDGILGGAAGGLVLGPIGLVGGAIIGATAGPGISRSWGLKGRQAQRPRRYVRRY